LPHDVATTARATRDAAHSVGELVGGAQRVKTEIESNIVYDKKQHSPRYKLAPNKIAKEREKKTT